MVRSVRVATALYLAVALPGLVFGWLVEAAPPRLPCDPTGRASNLMGFVGRTSGERCRTIDFTVLYWLIPAVVLLTIGAGIVLARNSPDGRSGSPARAG